MRPVKAKVFVPIIIIIFTIALAFNFIALAAIDAPHNESSNINCGSCHGQGLLNSPFWGGTLSYDQLCLNCHTASSGPYTETNAPLVKTHSSENTSEQYGVWARECRNCHDPHYQKQKNYKNTDSGTLFLATGTITNCVDNGNGTSTLTYSSISYKAGWDATRILEKTSEYRRTILFPNVGKLGYSYPVIGIDEVAKEITVLGDATPVYQYISSSTFAMMYGQYVKDNINDNQVKFLDQTGTNSYADGDTTYNGVCEVCHTLTDHYRNDGSGGDQNHANVGGAGGTNCISCHSHIYGFAHGGGEGTGCDACHGKDADNDGVGTTQSHSTHTENDADDARGPLLACGACHDTNMFPYFKSGTDSNGDGKYNLSETDVCDTCHSPDGTYDGNNNTAYGAKNNWSVGIYSGSSLKAGKEKWCASCHDESPSVIDGVTAPNIVGDEDGDYIYGTGWGYYKTGHGLSSGSKYIYSGGVTSGAGKGCLDCHESTVAHIDGNARTFDCGDGCDPTEYRQSYRLQQVGVNEPMEIPWTGLGGSDASKFRICTQAGCHATTAKFTSSSNFETNLVTQFEGSPVNRHEYHLNLPNQLRYPADYNYGGAYNSRINCVNCHNVHGSTQLAMIRDGKLIGREPGLKIWYNNDDIVSYNTASTNPPNPEDLPLSASTGKVWRPNTSSNLCTHCHANNNVEPEYRTPFQDVSQDPTLDWTGETSSYVSDGVNPDSGPSGSIYTFRVKYTDTNNDAPVSTEVWIDLNDNGDYNDPGEKMSMSEVDVSDTNYTNGKLYYRTETLSKAGDGNLNYRFYSSNGTLATGPPTNDSSVIILNAIPILSWTGDSYFVNDGVNPNAGGNGASFEFRISYTDTENEAPTSIQVWVDENDNGTYETGEKYDMTEMDGGDTTYSDGKLYTYTKTLAYSGDGTLDYRFYASDGTDGATGTPTSNSAVIVMSSANSPPFLDWVVANCESDGVRPGTGAAGTEFEFHINYTDPDNECATTIQVWIDENDNSTYEASEKYDLVEDDAGDTTCTDGKLYKVARVLSLAGDNSLNYRFYASDGTDTALGDPISDSTVSVVNAVTVRPSGSSLSYNYTSINTAANNETGTTIMVYPNDDFTATTYTEKVILIWSSGHDLTIQSACGAEITTISSSDGGTTISVQDVSNIAVDGFSITGANTASGVWVNRPDSTPVTIKNSKVYGNQYGIYINDGDNVSVEIENVEIYSNSIRGIHLTSDDDDANIKNSVIRSHNVSGNGAAIAMNNNNTVTISKSVIKDNITTGSGGAIYINGGSANLTITNSIITGNQGSNGGVITTNSGPTVSIVNSTIADNQGTNGGVFYICTTGSTTITNSIFWNNTSTSGNGANIYKVCGSGNIGTISYSDISTSSPGSIYDASYTDGGGNITPAQDPFFVGVGDYHIQSGSPCKDAITPASYSGPADDIEDDSRPQNTNYDMGADEYVP